MKTIRVSAAIIQDKGRIYATKRVKGLYKGWEFPGGKREEGETGEDAIIREIREELKTEIKVDKFLTTIEYTYPEFHLVMDCYLCSIEKGHLTLTEHEEASWLEIEEIDSLDWLPADILVVQELKKHFYHNCSIC